MSSPEGQRYIQYERVTPEKELERYSPEKEVEYIKPLFD